LTEHAALQAVARTFDESLDRHGPTAKSVLWFSETSQHKRFQVLTQLITSVERDSGGLVINDIGCGYGAFYHFLAEQGLMHKGYYAGYDISPRMIEQAKQCCPADQTQFTLSSVPTMQADFSFASGTFGHKAANISNHAWQQQMETVLQAMAANSRHGMGFNLLKRKPLQLSTSSTLFYQRPKTIKAFCQYVLGGQVTLIEHYLPNDFTVLIRF